MGEVLEFYKCIGYVEEFKNMLNKFKNNFYFLNIERMIIDIISGNIDKIIQKIEQKRDRIEGLKQKFEHKEIKDIILKSQCNKLIKYFDERLKNLKILCYLIERIKVKKNGGKVNLKKLK